MVLLTVVTMLYITFYDRFILQLEVCNCWPPSLIFTPVQSIFCSITVSDLPGYVCSSYADSSKKSIAGQALPLARNITLWNLQLWLIYAPVAFLFPFPQSVARSSPVPGYPGSPRDCYCINRGWGAHGSLVTRTRSGVNKHTVNTCSPSMAHSVSRLVWFPNFMS